MKASSKGGKANKGVQKSAEHKKKIGEGIKKRNQAKRASVVIASV